MKILIPGVVLAVFSGLFTVSLSAAAADTGTKVAFREPVEPVNTFRLADNNELVLGAAPREDAAESESIFGPVAEYLSKTIGRKVVYKYPGNWGVYQGMMQKGAYDIVFDGPHFTSWRVDRAQHNVLVKVPGDLVFVVLVKRDNDRITNLKQLAGRTVCAHAPPNLATLTVLNEFDNPARQPIIVNIDGWKDGYQSMLAGKCLAAVMPVKSLETFEKEGGRQARIVFRGGALPDNAFSAGPRLSPAEQEKIARALLSPEGEQATAKLRDKYTHGKSFAATSNKEFVGLSTYLKNEWGY